MLDRSSPWAARPSPARGLVHPLLRLASVLAGALGALGGLLGPTLAQAETAVFGPQEYLRTTGTPDTFSAAFPACRPERPFRLVIDNGPRGLTRVSSASLSLNGVEVLTSSDLNQQVARVERPVTLRPQNTLDLRVAGTPRGTLAVQIVSDQGCGITITEPTPLAAVPPGALLVRGTLALAGEIGVTVNGLPAAVHGLTFGVVLPVHADTTEIVAVATASDGTTHTARQPLAVLPGEPPSLVFRAKPAGGPAPHSVRFLLANDTGVASLGLDLTGAGAADFQAASVEELEAQTFRYDTPGLYFPRVTFTDPGGTTFSAHAQVHVVDRAALDAQLRARWTALKDALRQDDLPRALEAIAHKARSDYADLLAALTVSLGQIDQVLTDLTLVEMDDEEAEYEMVRVDDGLRMSHMVRFVRDADGRWRLEFF